MFCYFIPLWISTPKQIPPLDIFKFLFNELRNPDKKVLFIIVDEDESLARSSEFMKTCNNMGSIVQTTAGDVYYIKGLKKSPNKTLTNITRFLLLNSNHKKELW